jgi:hypothetical protein
LDEPLPLEWLTHSNGRRRVSEERKTMTQDASSPAYFTVSSGEKITVTLQSVQCNCNTAAGFDGSALTKSSSIPDVYAFQVSGASGAEKIFAGLCEFLAADPVTAHYTIAVASNQGGNFAVPSVYKEVPNASFQLYFDIA